MDVAEEGRGRLVVAQDRFRCVAHPRRVPGGESEEVGHVQGVRVQRVLLQDRLKCIHCAIDILELECI